MADKNYLSYCNVSDVVVEQDIIPDSDDYSDTLKLSNVDTFNVYNCKIVGGKEDCIDIMRGSCKGVISDCNLHPRGKYAITIKGGVYDVWLISTVIHGSGKSTEIEIGNYENASTPRNVPVRKIYIENVRRSDGKKVRVRIFNADIDSIVFKDGKENYDITIVPKFIWKTYFWLRDKGIL